MSKNKKKAPKKHGIISRIVKDIDSKGKRRLLFAIGLIAIAKLCLAIAPRLSGRITDSLAESANTGEFDTNTLIIRCVILALLFAIGYGADGFINRMMVTISQSLVRKLRNKAQTKLNHLPVNYTDTHPTGDILSRVTNDMVTMSSTIESTVVNLIGQFVLLVGLAVMMFITNWRLTLIYVVILPIGMLLLSFVIKMTGKLFRKQSDSIGQLNALVTDTYSNHMLMKAYGCEDKKVKDFNESNKVFYNTYIKSRFLSGFVFPITGLTNNFAVIALCIVGGILLIKGSLTIGEFQAFVFFGNMINTPLTSLSSSLNNIQSGMAAAERIYEFLDEEEEPQEEVNSLLDSNKVEGEVCFEHVSFGYLKDKRLMTDVSFRARPGQTMAIVGPSGAGKTTLINLLMRFYDIWDGSISVDGIDSSDITKAQLRSVFGMVLQDTWIFDGTIADNIGYGKPGATREDIIRAAKLVQCDTFIDKLPDGYDTHISEENSALSAGEMQLIAIARAVISDPKILILDEATSQVDTKTEALITQAMERMMVGRTTFIIAHRLYTIKNADQIIFMVDGDIKEVGSHDELIEAGGLYADMYLSGTSLGE